MSSPYLVALSHFKKIGPVSYRRLHDNLGSPEAVWQSSLDDLLAAEVSEQIAREFMDWRQTADPAALVAAVERLDMSTVDIHEPNYPELLKAIHDPPYLLYYRGTLPQGDALGIGVVGSRKASPYGLQVAYDLSLSLAKAGLVIVSGLAWGIDEAAHKAALAAGGTTIAVLACGLNANDSSRKEQLAAEIVRGGGAIISEFAPGTPPLRQHFPIRNRIIAGISKGTIVVEAAIKSGSLITAHAALRENREVFAVPGPITSPTSEGTNDLIKTGAHVVTKANDVLEVLGVAVIAPDQQPQAPTNLSPTAKTIYDALSKVPSHIDDITRTTGLPGHTVRSELAMLEMQGAVRNLGGMLYIR